MPALALGAAALPSHAAEPIHVYDAASEHNLTNAHALRQWTDVGPGHAYGGAKPLRIHIDHAVGVDGTGDFRSRGTRFTASYRSSGNAQHGAKPQRQPQHSSIGHGLVDATFELWLRTDLADETRDDWQVIFESGGSGEGFALLLRTNGPDAAELRLLKASHAGAVADLRLPLARFERSEFIQVVAVFDGDTVEDGDDLVRLVARDALGVSVSGESADGDFTEIADRNDTGVFNSAGERFFGRKRSLGGNRIGETKLIGFDGEIALIRVYPVALRDAEIAAAWSERIDRADRDGDGMTDFAERRHGFDPKDPSDAEADADGDGLSNLRELQAGSDPHGSSATGEAPRGGADDGAD